MIQCLSTKILPNTTRKLNCNVILSQVKQFRKEISASSIPASIHNLFWRVYPFSFHQCNYLFDNGNSI